MKIVSDATLYVNPGEPIEPGTPVDLPKAEAQKLIDRGLVRPHAEPRRGATVDAGGGGDGKAAGDDGKAAGSAGDAGAPAT